MNAQLERGLSSEGFRKRNGITPFLNPRLLLEVSNQPAGHPFTSFNRNRPSKRPFLYNIRGYDSQYPYLAVGGFMWTHKHHA